MVRRRRLLFLLLAAFAALLAACGLLGADDPGPAATPTSPIPTPADTPPPIVEGTAVAPPTPSGITLTVWTVAAVSPRTEIPGGSILTEQLAAFDASHPDVTLNVEIKTVSDQGGILSYLRTGRAVAPSVLPHLVLLPADQLAGAAGEALIVPLDGLIGPELRADLFPAAARLGRVGDQLYGYPYVLSNLQHLAYDPAVVTGTLATSWSAFLDDGVTLAIPAAGAPGADLGLMYYLGQGGSLINEANQSALELEPLNAALSALAEGRARGVIIPQSSNAISFEGAWQLFQSGAATVVHTNASQFLNRRAQGIGGGFAPLPGPNGPLVPLLHGLTWAVTTTDPVQQALAQELIAWLATPANLGAWTNQSMMLPARSSAFDHWPEGAYTVFARRELERAQPYPARASGTIVNALSTAVADVISQARTPAGAATEAANAVAP